MARVEMRKRGAGRRGTERERERERGIAAGKRRGARMWLYLEEKRNAEEPGELHHEAGGRAEEARGPRGEEGHRP